jgi:DNA-binding NarL/FixJ family response regulator
VPPATPAERRYVEAYLSAGSMKGVAEIMRTSEGTVRSRFARFYKRHGVRNITELAVLVLDRSM